MYKNYFFLNRTIIELNEQLHGYTIVEIYSQEKDTLNFIMRKGADEKYLEICTGSSTPYLMLKDKMNRAKKNTLDFFSHILPTEIGGILIAENERVILFICQDATISFFIRGNNSNIYAEKPYGVFTPFRSCEDDVLSGIKDELGNILFTNSFFEPDLQNASYENLEVFLKEKYLTISKEIIREAKYRLQNHTDEELKNEIIKILGEIENNTPVVMLNEATHEMLLTVNTFKSFPYTQIKEFETLNEALNYYIGRKYYLENLAVKKRLIDRHLKRELTKLTSKLDALNNRLNTPSREEEYNKIANLLLININKLRKGDKTVELEDIYNDSQLLKIKLDESLAPKANIDNYYRKAKSEKVNIEKSKTLYNSAFKEFTRLKECEAKFNCAVKLDDYEQIMKELKMESNPNKGNRKNEDNFNFKQYIIDKKYNVYVGKDSTNNDLLTTKFAKQNDFWFHARSVPGSHVVLRVDNTKEAVPKSVLKAAAALAAYHSKAKTASTAPVTYTLKKYVYKKKGMDVGQVALTKEEVLLVRPEIPANCEYVTED